MLGVLILCLSTVYLLDFGTVPKLRYRYIYIFNLHHFASINLIISHMYHERHRSQIKKGIKKKVMNSKQYNYLIIKEIDLYSIGWCPNCKVGLCVEWCFSKYMCTVYCTIYDNL